MKLSKINLNEWRRVPGFDFIYASREGEIVNIWTHRTYSPVVTNAGYAMVHIDKKMHSVARLVLQAWYPLYDDEYTADHINRDTLDNRLENLRWASRKTQMENRKSTIGVPRRLRRCRCVETQRVFDSASEAARMTGIHVNTLMMHLNGKSKSAGKLHFEEIDD